ncbi:MAG: exo-alpha-sialidase, partial [Paenibacillus sp.]|nr:exo-alpha-sialidase [Paenibacillus sp.]
VRCWISDDQGSSWREPIHVADEASLKLCEPGAVELSDGTLVCIMRENSFQGLDAYKAISRDGGESWAGVWALPLPGCHRPTPGVLRSGSVLVTHRMAQGGKGGWGSWQNFFGALLDETSCAAMSRQEARTRLFPIDFDRNPKADTGYSGWAQFDDGEIYVVNYIVDDAPNGHIRGYSFRESELELGR